jgi:hypothetical protein
VTDDKTWTETWDGVTYVVSHGCPFDRGMADSWYSRKVDPHYWPQGTYDGHRVGRDEMTPEQVAEYVAGYAFNEHLGGKKDYG